MAEKSVKKKVEPYLKDGWSIAVEGKDYITLKKPKRFNGALCFILLLLGFFPALIYILYYASKSEQNITIDKSSSENISLPEIREKKGLIKGLWRDATAPYRKSK